MKHNANHTRENEVNIIGQILFRYMPYWPLFLILGITAFAGGWLYLKFKTPLYESSARLLIKDERKGAEDAKAIEELNLLSTKKIIENETEVIQSRTLIGNVVTKLGLYAPIYRKGRFRDQPYFTDAPVLIDMPDPSKIVEAKKVSFSMDTKSNTINVAGKKYPLDQFVATPYGRMRFRMNVKAPAEGDYYFNTVNPGVMAGLIQSRLSVSPSSKTSSVLNLSLKDEAPDRAMAILNELLSTYAEAQVQDKDTLAASTLAFVEERLRNVEADLHSIEQRAQQYKTAENAVDISTQGKLFLENVSVNDQKLSDINTQLAVLGQVESYVQSRHAPGSVVPATMGIADPLLSQLLDKLYTSELEYEKMKTTVGENNPMLVSLNEQITRIKPGILDNIQNQRLSLLASRNTISSTNNAYSSILQGLPRKEKELIDISRDQNVKNSIYAFLLQKREETALTKASTVANSQVIEKAAASGSPVTPKPKIVYLSALLIALFGGVGLVTAKESLSRKVMFRHQIESLTQQPVIGEIASGPTREPIVIGEAKKTFVAEQFRKLRTTLKFIGIDSRHKKILVTSAISGEGKSFVATNLALSLALTGKRVVLMDCDLNNPSLNQKLNIRNEKGVAEYLAGAAGADEIVFSTDIHENLFFISPGSLPSNPSELIMNGKMEELLWEMEKQFDYVVVDTAPVSPVTDAYILSPYCDATLFVVRHKYTPKIFLERLDEENKVNNLKNLAIIFNGVQSRGFGNSNYGYGYGYGYIYGDKGNNKNKPFRLRIFNS